MKYAFMSFSTPDLSLERTLNLARQYGYEEIEPQTDSSHAHGIKLCR